MNIKINLAQFTDSIRTDKFPAIFYKFIPEKIPDTEPVHVFFTKFENEFKSYYKEENDVISFPYTKDNSPYAIICIPRTQKKISLTDNPLKLGGIRWKWTEATIDGQIGAQLRLISNAIKNSLEKKDFIVTPSRKYFFHNEPVTANVYTSDPIKYEHIYLYPGFRYSVERLNTKFGVFIDRTSILLSKKSLRDEFKEKGYQIFRELLRPNTLVWDGCPHIDCEHALAGKCPLSPPKGRAYRIIGYLKESPSSIPIGKTNLLKYNYERCIWHQMENKDNRIKLSDEPPAVQVLPDRQSFAKPYSYPLERLRKQIDLRTLKDENRKSVMQSIHVDPYQRHDDTQLHLKFLSELSINNTHIDISTHFISVEKEKIFDIPHFQLNRQYKTFYPGKDIVLKKAAPYDLKQREFNHLNLVVFWDERISVNDVDTVIKDLHHGFPNQVTKKQFKGLEELFRLKITISKWDNPVDSFEPEENTVFLGVLSDKSAIYNEINRSAMKKHVGCQSMKIRSLKYRNNPRTKSRYISILENVALGIYANAGGHPWVLSDKLNHFYIGLSVYPTKSTYIGSLIIIDPFGSFIKGKSFIIEGKNKKYLKISYAKELRELLAQAKQICQEHGSEHITLHKKGIEYPEELEVAGEFVERVITISDARIERLFDIDRDDYLAMAGTCAFIPGKEKEALLVTTTEMVKPDTTPKPKKVKLHLPEHDSLTYEDLEAIFKLSRLQIHYWKGIAGDAVSYDFAYKANKKIRDLNKSYPKAWYDFTWFI